MAERILEVKDLKTYFYVEDGELRAVDGLSYDVDKGQCVAIVGESACGKSVSVLYITRLIPYPRVLSSVVSKATNQAAAACQSFNHLQ